MTKAVIPCEECETAVFDYDGTFLNCACPFRDERGRCQCDEAKKIMTKIGGA